MQGISRVPGSALLTPTPARNVDPLCKPVGATAMESASPALTQVSHQCVPSLACSNFDSSPVGVNSPAHTGLMLLLDAAASCGQPDFTNLLMLSDMAAAVQSPPPGAARGLASPRALTPAIPVQSSQVQIPQLLLDVSAPLLYLCWAVYCLSQCSQLCLLDMQSGMMMLVDDSLPVDCAVCCRTSLVSCTSP